MIPFGSKDCRELLLQLLVYDPDDRISARQAVRHPFFKEMRFEIFSIFNFKSSARKNGPVLVSSKL